jgi:hypothetical protein
VVWNINPQTTYPPLPPLKIDEDIFVSFHAVPFAEDHSTIAVGNISISSLVPGSELELQKNTWPTTLPPLVNEPASQFLRHMYLHSSALSLYIQAMMWVSSKERENAVCTSGSRKYREKYNYNLLILRENPLVVDQHQHLHFLHFIHFHTPTQLLHHQRINTLHPQMVE